MIKTICDICNEEGIGEYNPKVGLGLKNVGWNKIEMLLDNGVTFSHFDYILCPNCSLRASEAIEVME